ncbi:uncharacterized protein LOC119575560 [Penaeus monodon]|uniref:uncharacterized protein LOC119575560 n=1 Tax=Penaeus monodon TaxID=6687 RepID=UPI0018A6E359|nr:uncharacterized protein LOC119575560 [Penaeus monodon]
MSRGDTEIPVSEDYATSEEPTMPILVEEGLASSMPREPLHINDNDAYPSSEEPTMPKLTIEDLPAHPVQNSIENIVTGITTPAAETKPLGRKRRRTKTWQHSCDSGTEAAQLRRVGMHSCNLCQSIDTTTPKRPWSEGSSDSGKLITKP